MGIREWRAGALGAEAVVGRAPLVISILALRKFKGGGPTAAAHSRRATRVPPPSSGAREWRRGASKRPHRRPCRNRGTPRQAQRTTERERQFRDRERGRLCRRS